MKFESIAEQFFLSTTRITTRSKTGVAIGTGFFFQIPLPNKETSIHVVTNKHVVFNKDRIDLELHIGKTPYIPDPTKKFTYTTLEDAWNIHPDQDLALLPMGKIMTDMYEQYEKPIVSKSFGFDNTPTKEDLVDIDAIEDVFFIGYPIGLYDDYYNLPLLRKGITASPINHDWKNQPRFLIDGNVFPGSSGSPVFVFDKGMYITPKGYFVGKTRFFFLGMLSEGYVWKDSGEIEAVNIPTSVEETKHEQFINLGSVLKSSVILDFARELLPS